MGTMSNPRGGWSVLQPVKGRSPYVLPGCRFPVLTTQTRILVAISSFAASYISSSGTNEFSN